MTKYISTIETTNNSMYIKSSYILLMKDVITYKTCINIGSLSISSN